MKMSAYHPIGMPAAGSRAKYPDGERLIFNCFRLLSLTMLFVLGIFLGDYIEGPLRRIIMSFRGALLDGVSYFHENNLTMMFLVTVYFVSECDTALGRIVGATSLHLPCRREES